MNITFKIEISLTKLGSAEGLAPGNRTEGSTMLYKIVRPELPSIPFPVANPVAELGNDTDKD